MNFHNVRPEEWLSDKHLSKDGMKLRREYSQFCMSLETPGVLSFQSARSKYFLQRAGYWGLPEGWALPPHTLNVCVNNICNMRCRYCDFGQKHEETFYHEYNVVEAGKRIELSLDEMKDLVDQSAWYRPIIRASFREPLMHKDILPFIAYTKEKGLPFWLLTNGMNLPKVAKELVELDLDSIRLSMDGPPEVHNEIRGVKVGYQRMMEGVKMLVEERRRKKSNLQIGFYFTINDANYQHLAATIDCLAAEGILKEVFFNFQWLLYTTKSMAQAHNAEHAEICGGYVEESTVQSVDIFKMDLESIDAQRRDIQARYPAEEGYRIHFRPSFELEDLTYYRDTEDFPVEDPRCMTPWYNMNINPAGQVKCFHHCLLPVAGNTKEKKALDIWNGEVFRDQRRKLQEHGAYKGCARCWGIYCLLEDQKRKD